MQPFELISPVSVADAQRHVVQDPVHRVFRAGGIDLLDRLKEGLDAPEQLVELRRAKTDDQGSGDEDSHGGALGRTDINPESGVTIGALVTLATLASADFAAISLDLGHLGALQAAAGEAATPSIRNMATVGGNLLQRPRCWYYRNAELTCLKKGGDTCLAVSGDNRYNAILGGGPSYIVHPSSLGAALSILDARLIISGPPHGPRLENGDVAGPAEARAPKRREVELASLFVGPAEDPTREHRLAPGEVLVAVVVPAQPSGTRSAYEAAREKQSHDWPLAEAAVRLRIVDGKIEAPRICLGHVAPIPWNTPIAQDVLEGQRPSAELFAQAALASTQGAKPLAGNAYKVPLVQGLVRKALHRAAAIPLPA